MKFEELAYPARKHFYIEVWKPYLKLANEAFKETFEKELRTQASRWDFEVKQLDFDHAKISLTYPKRKAKTEPTLPINYSDWACPGRPGARQGFAAAWNEWAVKALTKDDGTYEWDRFVEFLTTVLNNRLRIPSFVEIQYFGPYFDEFWGDFRPNGIPYVLNDNRIELVV